MLQGVPLPPPPSGLDLNFLVTQIVPLIGAVVALAVGALVLRWLFRSPIGEAIAEGIRLRRRRRYGGDTGEVTAGGQRVEALEEHVAQLAKAKQQVASAIADEKRLAGQVDQEKKAAEDWEKRAVLAVQEGRDDLAKQALLRHNEHAQGAVTLHETWVKHREETEKLKISLRQLNDKIEEAKRKKNILIARQKRAEAHKRIQETMSSIGDKSAFETFERMAEQIEHEERKLIAAAEVNEDLSGDTLVKQFQSLEVKADADEQLLELKKKMGLLGAGAPPDTKQLGKGAADAELVEDDDPGHPR